MGYLAGHHRGVSDYLEWALPFKLDIKMYHIFKTKNQGFLRVFFPTSSHLPHFYDVTGIKSRTDWASSYESLIYFKT